MSLSRGAPNLFVASVVAGFLLIGLVLMIMLGAVQGWSLLIAGTWGAMLIGRPKLLLFIYWCWITVSIYVQSRFGNMLTIWGDEMLVALMLGVLLTHHIRARIVLPELKMVKRALMGLVALIVMSALANRVPKLLAFHFALQYMRFFLLIYYAYYFLSSKDLPVVLATIVWLFLLQVVLNVGWLLGINPLPNWMSGPDFAIGTGLGANLVGYYSVAIICLMIAYLRSSSRPWQKIGGGALLLAALFQLYISFTFHAYLVCGICVAFQLYLSPRPIHEGGVQLGVAAAAAVVLVVIASQLPAAESVRRFFHPDYLKFRWRNMVDGPKGQSYKNNFYYLPKEVPFFLVGAGAGNAGSMVGRMNRRPLADKYFNWVDLAVESKSISGSGSIAGGPMTGILALWSELGPFGLLLYWGLQIYAGVRVARAVRRGRYTHRHKRILAEAFPPVQMMLVAVNVLADYSFLAFMNGGIWIWAACVWTPEESDVPPSARVTDAEEPSDVWKKVLAQRAETRA
jgi:hypothetical protein